MISLDHIELLEQRVEQAVTKITQLLEENRNLQQKNSELEEKNRQLQSVVVSFEQNQEKIEQGIILALERLNIVENTVLQTAESLPSTDFSPTDRTAENTATSNTYENSNISPNSNADLPQTPSNSGSPVEPLSQPVQEEQPDLISENDDQLFDIF